ncbi:MAG: hypothetical protein AABZ15_01620 [Nitrospirota bacterium]
MKTRVLLSALVFPLLSACFVAPPEVPLHEVPAGPIVAVLQQRRQAFTGMKAVARVETERKGRKRVYESVAILQQRFDKLRIEGYGPMGESVIALVWDGTDVLVRKAGEPEPMKVGQFGLERIIGVPLLPADLCSILSGNIPGIPDNAEATVGCAQAGWCIVDFRHEDQRWKIRIEPKGGANGDLRIDTLELYRGERLVVRSAFAYLKEGVNQVFPDPTLILINSPDRDMSVTVAYEDVDMHVAVEDGAFVLGGEGAGK